MQAGCQILRRLPIELQTNIITKKLTWRDLVALMACCDYEGRTVLSSKELKCVGQKIFNSCCEYKIDGLNWAAMKTMPKQDFIDEYNILWKRIGSFRCYDSLGVQRYHEHHNSNTSDSNDNDNDSSSSSSSSNSSSSSSSSSSSRRRKRRKRRGFARKFTLKLNSATIAIDRIRHRLPIGRGDVEQVTFHPQLLIVAYTTLDDDISDEESNKQCFLHVRHVGRLPQKWTTSLLFQSKHLRPYKESNEAAV